MWKPLLIFRKGFLFVNADVVHYELLSWFIVDY